MKQPSKEYRNSQQTRKRGGSSGKLPGILTAHRWAGELAAQLWRCVPSAAFLQPVGLDPICYGCRLAIAYTDVPEVGRFRGEWMTTPLGQEALAVQLDILAAGKETHAREELFRGRLHLVQEKRRTGAA